MDVRFEVMNETDLKADSQFWRILAESIPAEERDSPEMTVRCLSFEGVFYVRLKYNDQTIGLVTFLCLHEPSFVYLGYMAVDSRYRSHGFGSEIVKFVEKFATSYYRARGKLPLGIVAEIENPENYFESKEVLTCKKRLRFYEKNRFIVLHSQYLMPPHREEYPISMMLCARPMAGQKPEILPSAFNIIKSLYSLHYAPHKNICSILLDNLLNTTFKNEKM